VSAACPEWQGRILLCQRAINGRRLLDYGRRISWKTVKPCSRRGARVAEEARPGSRSAHLLAITHVLHCVAGTRTFRARCCKANSVSARSLQDGLYRAEIPWKQESPSRASSSRCAAIRGSAAWHLERLHFSDINRAEKEPGAVPTQPPAGTGRQPRRHQRRGT